MKSLLCALILTVGISQSFAIDAQANFAADIVGEFGKSLPKAIGGMVSKSAKSSDEWIEATALAGICSALYALHKGDRQVFTNLFLKEYLQGALFTKGGLLLYSALITDRKATKKAIADFYRRYAHRLPNSSQKKLENKTIPVPQLGS